MNKMHGTSTSLFFLCLLNSAFNAMDVIELDRIDLQAIKKKKKKKIRIE